MNASSPGDRRDQWATSVVLADGEVGYVRPMTVDDAPALLAFHERQPRENLYRRFFSPKPTLTPTELAHFTDVDFVDRVALVLEIRGEFCAWASYERWPGRDDADVAFLVDDAHRGQGIGTLLLEHLAAIAHSNGIQRFTADVLADNRPMLRVFAKAGWPVQRHFDSGVMELEFPLVDTDQYVDSVEQREHRADSRAVARLLLPRSIAVIGASDEVGSIGHELWRRVSAGTLPAFAVNARHDTIGGRRAYRSILDIEEDVWLAVVATPAATLADVIDECIRKRVRGAVVVTATDGTDVDVPALVAHARRNGMRIIGPASMGIATGKQPGVSQIQAALAPVHLPPGRIAVSMQSGSLGASFLRLAGEMSVGLSWFVSLGEKSDVSGNDLMQFWEDDEHTGVIALYTESFGNPRKFARIARRVGRTRPIVAVRTGAAAIGSAGEALYQQAGLIEVPTVRALLDTARVLATQPVPAGPRVAVLTNARSPGVLARAALEAAGLTVVDPPVPLDWRSRNDDFGVAVAAAIASSDIDAILVVHAPPIASSHPPAAAIDSAASGSAKPVVAVMLGRGDGPVREGSAVPSFAFPETAAAVLGRMCRYRRWLDTEAEHAVIETMEGLDREEAGVILAAALERGDTVAGSVDAMAVLAAYGVHAPQTILTHDATADEIVSAAHALEFPVALKSLRRRPGRSAAAGVALDLHDEASVRDALTAMRASLGDDGRSIVVQRMVPPGVDVRIRCTTDGRLGPVVTIGLGGVHADAIGDESSRLAPVSPAGAANLVTSSRAGAALASAGIDTAPLVDAIVRIGRLVADHPEIAELDINPAVVGATGCEVVDVRITLGPGDHHDEPLRRLG
ncbi:MAG: GNAT family N-acetyltransferase [Ilumatobacteraceae bacterium]